MTKFAEISTRKALLRAQPQIGLAIRAPRPLSAHGSQYRRNARRFHQLTATPGKTHTKRCYQCNGRFGLIRRRFAMKQFCSTRCVDEYKTTERTIRRIKVW